MVRQVPQSGTLILAVAAVVVLVSIWRDIFPAGSPLPSPAPEARDARTALVNFSRAYHFGDRALFWRSVSVRDDARAQIELSFETDLARRAFVADFDRTYRELLDPPTVLWVRTVKEAASAAMIEKSIAEVVVPGAPMARLVKEGGLWKVNLNPAAGEVWSDRVLLARRAELDAIGRLRARIGEAGASAIICREFERAVAAPPASRPETGPRAPL